jgi:hypothetical protein
LQNYNGAGDIVSAFIPTRPLLNPATCFYGREALIYEKNGFIWEGVLEPADQSLYMRGHLCRAAPEALGITYYEGPQLWG